MNWRWQIVSQLIEKHFGRSPDDEAQEYFNRQPGPRHDLMRMMDFLTPGRDLERLIYEVFPGSEVYVNSARARGRKCAKTSRRIVALWAAHSGRCHLCGYLVPEPKMHGQVPRPPANWPTIDHVVPVSEGGGNETRNLALAHHYCNGLRGTRPVTDELRAEVREQARAKFTRLGLTGWED